MKWMNQKGMGMTEVLIGAGMLGGLAVVGTQMFKNQSSAQKTVEQGYESVTTVAAIRGILADPYNCKQTLGGRPPGNATPAVPNIVKKVGAADEPLYAVGSQLPGTTMKLGAYGLNNTYPGLASNETMFMVNFDMGQSGLREQVKKTIRIIYTLDASNLILTCYAVANGDSLWEISPVDPANIFYAAGNVGVNTVDPKEKFHLYDGNVRIEEGHMAIGNTAEVDKYTTGHWGPRNVPMVLSIEEDVPAGATPYVGLSTILNITGAMSDSAYGIHNWIYNRQAGNINGMKAVSNMIYHYGAGNLSYAQSNTNGVWLQSTGNTSYVAGTQNAIDNNGPGTITDAFGTWTRILKRAAGGPITNSYGHYISQIDGTNKWSIYASDGSAPSYFAGRVDANGGLTVGPGAVASGTDLVRVNGNALALAWNTTSDKRLKKNISAITNPVEIVSSLRGVNFTWKNSGAKDVGFIAQEVEAVEPRLVNTTSTADKLKSVKYGNIIAIVVEAMKSEISSRKRLESELESLRDENQKLQERLQRLEDRIDGR